MRPDPETMSLALSERERANGHRSAVFWLTGLSAAGKSTLASGAEQLLYTLGYQVCVLDGDRLRAGINADLGFSDEDRQESTRRAGHIAAHLAGAGMIVLVAHISPFEQGRQRARLATAGDFFEIHVATPLALCEARDPKGLYRKARAGEIPAFTGLSSRYEAPVRPDLRIDTTSSTPSQSIDELVQFVRTKVEFGRFAGYRAMSGSRLQASNDPVDS